MGIFSRSNSSDSNSSSNPAPTLQGSHPATEPATVAKCQQDYKSGADTRAKFTEHAKSDGWWKE